MPLIAPAAQVFETVAQCGSIRRASERLNVAASAINRRILGLEEELGTALFERHARGLRPTEAGTLLAAMIRSWQTDDADLRKTICALKGRPPEIRVGAMECLTYEFIPNLLNRHKDLATEASVTITVGSTEEISNLLAAGDIDVAIAFNLPDKPNLVKVHEMIVPLGVVVQSKHPLATLNEAGIDDLAPYPIVLADKSMPIGQLARVLLERLRMPVEEITSTNSITLLKALVRSGDGVSFMTSIDVHQEIRDGSFRFIPISGVRFVEHLSISLRRASQPETIAGFVELLKAELVKLSDTDLAESKATL